MQAVLGIVWSIAWALLVYESPSVHPWISNKEKVYILESLGDTFHEKGKVCSVVQLRTLIGTK